MSVHKTDRGYPQEEWKALGDYMVLPITLPSIKHTLIKLWLRLGGGK